MSLQTRARWFTPRNSNSVFCPVIAASVRGPSRDPRSWCDSYRCRARTPTAHPHRGRRGHHRLDRRLRRGPGRGVRHRRRILRGRGPDIVPSVWVRGRGRDPELRLFAEVDHCQGGRRRDVDEPRRHRAFGEKRRWFVRQPRPGPGADVHGHLQDARHVRLRVWHPLLDDGHRRGSGLMRPGFVTIGRWVAAALILGGGAIHLKLYFDSYRDFPNANLGRSFLLNAIASLVAAILLVVWRNPLSLLAGLVLVNATLLAFALSRTSNGIFDFTETGFNPSPEAVLSLVFE